MDLAHIGTMLLLVFGFGFVIFWHELGHFLAAKWAGVKVEQFAVGFGHAMFSWRKGLGLRYGSSREEYDKQLEDYLAVQDQHAAQQTDLNNKEQRIEYASAQLGISETEYRLNWIPLGGYVKMLGQDDLDPNSISQSPRAFNNKPISKRMVIVSAGVVMNIILAIIFFTILFRMGFNVSPPVVGAVVPGSPAQEAGVRVGDTIVKLDGVEQTDFTKIAMNSALLEEGQAVPLVVRDPDGKERSLTVTARRPVGDASSFLRIGVEPSPELRGLDLAKLPADWDADKDLVLSDAFAIRPGESIIAVNGQPVELRQFYKLYDALQQSSGKPVTLTLKDAKGNTREQQIQPLFSEPFSSQQISFAGMVPRASVVTILEDSSARHRLQPGDAILSLTIQPSDDRYENLPPMALRDKLAAASKSGSTVDMTVLRDGQEVAVKGLTAQVKLDNGAKGLGIGPGYDAAHPVIGGVEPDSAAERAKIPAGATIESLDGQPVQNWFDVQRILAAIDKPRSVAIVVSTPSGKMDTALDLTQDEIADADSVRYWSAAFAGLHELSEPRQTTNPLTAAKWGVTETRDLIVQFYLTIRRMFEGSVAPSNAMGPIGIFHQGSKIAYRGMDWLIWFLAMISANLAVVNFLPIPIVDGGLFVFLILEKIMGKPLSPKAQSIAQIVGLALIASVFLFVTYHDIARLIL